MLFVCHWEANKKKKDFWAYYINFFGMGMKDDLS